MALRRSLFPRLFLGPSLVLMILALGACAKKEAAKNAETAEGGEEPFLSSAGSLLYFKGGVGGDTSIATSPQAHTGGGPTTSTGDQVAWVLYGSTSLTVTSLTFPATTSCGTSNVPAGWTPYGCAGSVQGVRVLRSSHAAAGRGTNNGQWNLYYKITLSDGSGPCGHIIIVKP